MAPDDRPLIDDLPQPAELASIGKAAFDDEQGMRFADLDPAWKPSRRMARQLTPGEPPAAVVTNSLVGVLYERCPAANPYLEFAPDSKYVYRSFEADVSSTIGRGTSRLTMFVQEFPTSWEEFPSLSSEAFIEQCPASTFQDQDITVDIQPFGGRDDRGGFVLGFRIQPRPEDREAFDGYEFQMGIWEVPGSELIVGYQMTRPIEGGDTLGLPTSAHAWIDKVFGIRKTG